MGIRVRIYRVALCGLLLFAALIGGCAPRGAVETALPISAQNFFLDTVVSITIYDSSDQSLLADAFDEISRLEQILSAVYPGSDPDRLAQNAGLAFTGVSDETLYLVQKSAWFSTLSDGAFDCTVGPLVALWGIKDGKGHYPSGEELQEALSMVDYRDVDMWENNQMMLKTAGMKVDLGAIAKGYIADMVRNVLISKGVNSAVIDLGGNVVLIGNKPDGTAFRIGVRDPEGGANAYFGIIEAAGKSLVSSGSYERFFWHEGMQYHHIFDANTGLPVDNGLLQVTILSDSSAEGDGFSTVAFLLGLERGLALVAEMEGVEAVFVTTDKKVYVTEGMQGKLTLVSDDYEISYR